MNATRRLHALNSGRFRVFWLHHGQEAKNAAYLVAIVAIFLTASHMDYQDAVNAEKAARADVEQQLRQERIARALPGTVYIIEAATPAEAQSKFARIAGGADAERYRLWSVTK